MRIISGSRRGRKLIDFEGDSIRPTTDRVKESVFNLIQEFVAGSSVLDLFGGSGALSLEALSRGADRALIIDSSKSSIDIINKNVSLTGFEEKAEILCTDAKSFISDTKRKFDIIFLDPPYNKGFVLPVLKTISEKELLTADGIAVLESDFCDDHGDIPGLEILKQRKYGRTFITIYKRDN
mgnify:CR=1 FL=1